MKELFTHTVRIHGSVDDPTQDITEFTYTISADTFGEARLMDIPTKDIIEGMEFYTDQFTQALAAYIVDINTDKKVN